ncbi:Cif family virulence factor [Ferrimonas marina]|uniref:SnoaL-like domain-containing protein n=1 Tax=Ferrimonas marina TaxID=299255 RepID=A0A1M5XES5_9GAMM|nr:hypothetical protein [Ferrimonas marina]SHH97703.1 hypothetical protein SAMN02745129_3446 [Ferrimonas marina]
MNNQERLIEVLQASHAWIDHFNFGDADYCVQRYNDDALLVAKPVGEFHGQVDIDAFWRPFMASGATDLVYTNIWLKEVDADTVVLGADFSMNVARGVITHEEWVHTDNGVWKLKRDEFEILERFDP